ncbi:MAG: MFS transporter [Alphaproteobacteria bacterium]|nr:MFS transporter [Alphaproteobacteria bacterium]
MTNSVEGDRQPPGLMAVVGGVAALLISVALLLTGNGLQGTLIPVRGNLENFTAVEIGLIGTGYYIGFTLGCLVGPALLRRGGHIRTFMAMASLASVAVLIHAMVLDSILWAVLRGITGTCFAVLYIVIESWLNEKSTNETRGTIFSIYTVINLTVITVGQLMIALDDPLEFSLFAAASILVSVAALPLAFTKAEAPGPIHAVQTGLGLLYRNSPVGVATCLAVGLANGAFWTLGPVFAQDRGMDTAGIGLFMSAVVAGGALGQYPLGAISDRVDRRYVILAAVLLAILAGVGLTFFSPAGSSSIYIFGALFGAGALPIYSLGVAHANDHAAPNEMVEVSSGLLLAFGLGAAIGPPLAALVQNLAPFQALFSYTASIHALLALVVLWRMSRRGKVLAGERVDFAESVITAQTVSTIETATADIRQDGPEAPGAKPKDAD